jgi:hypothetical protein
MTACEKKPNEKTTMKITALIISLSLLWLETPQAQTTGNLMKVNYRSLVSRADLSFDTPVVRSEEGMPIGNGRMGTLVWTTPSALHFQINHVDLFCMGNNTLSFPKGHTDYSSGCGYVDINLVDYGDDVFTGKKFNQHLSVYEGLTTADGNGIKSRTLAWNDGDVIATELDDQRSRPSAVNIDLRTLRFAVDFIEKKNFDLSSNHASQIRTGLHSATSRLDIRDGKVLLIQEFREGNFYSASAVAIGVVGRKSKAAYYNETTVRLSAAPGRGKVLILTASALSYDPKADVGALALKQLDAAQAKSFDRLLEDNRNWWSGYWAKAFVHLHSADGVADEVEKNYTYFLYIMASCSRGEYMPRFCGMLWGSNGDLRMWGSQYWWHNQGTYFNGFTPANRPELMTPMFATYSRNFESFARAARQQWGSQGIWIPETTWFDGLEDLPENIAAEMRDLYLAKKPWETRSKKFDEFSKDKNGLNSRWNWNFLANKKGPFAWTSHIMSTTAKISYLYWLHYAYSLDQDWLRTNGYPMIKGTAEFYRNFPNLYKADDGKYHIRYVNNLESAWGGSDAPEELSAMYEMLPVAIRASEILGVDADHRPLWREVLDNLTPIPASALEPGEYYDLCNIGIEDRNLFERVLAAYHKRNANGVNEKTTVRVLSRMPVMAANLGLANDVKVLIPAQIRSVKEDNCDYPGSGESGVGVLRNRLMLREGPGAIECERLGIASHALQNALLQSVPPSPGKDAANYIFPAWPREWDAQFTLAARDAFLISASMDKGRIEFVEIQSQKGGQCRVQNPWPDADVTLYRNGKQAEDISGVLLAFSTVTGETITMVPKGKPLLKKVLQ